MPGLRFVAAAFAALPLVLAAQNFPARPVTLTVGFAPGGGTDTAARVIAKKLTENIGQPVVVENKAGAGGNIAAEDIANAPPDGYRIHLTSVGPMTVAPAMTPNLRYDPRKDIAPITMGVVFPNVMIVHPGVKVKTLAEWVALAKKEPGKHSFGSSGIGGAGHLAGELFNQAAKIDVIHVPYKGGGPAMTDLLGGRIDMYIAVPSTAQSHIEAGKVTALATTGLQRTKAMPNVPTVAEQGYPGFEAVNWYAFVAPGKTPRTLIDYWNRELVRALKDPEVSKELAKHGLEPQPGTPEELAKYIDAETEKWARVVKAANIKAE